MRYAVVIERDESSGSYGAYAPDLPGCGAAADSLEEAVQLIQEAIRFHIEGLVESGLPVPEPTTQVDYVEMQFPA
jgi:predicted RNase H-like HicB family nuclease